VYGLLRTAKGVSPIGTGYVVTTLVGFTAIYTLLAIIDFGLMAKYAKLDPDGVDEHGAPRSGEEGEEADGHEDDDRVPALIY
jgi:cytochrome d ubiquinol oxidase subunit I